MQITQTQTSTLIPYAMNAKKHSEHQVSQIAASIKEFGFCNPVLIDNENGIIAGHGRVMAAKKLGMDSVPCVILGHLTEAQRKAYVIADNRLAETGGGWDDEMLKAELDALGKESSWLDLDQVLADLEKESDTLSDDYTHKVNAPVYTPKGEKPPVIELFNSERADDLLSKIESSKAVDEVKRFLKIAAARHVVFDYGKIAEFYCHADKETQALMEDSALVIIDFKKAMQLGYVKLKAEIADALESEQSGEGAEDDDDE